jgi:hypothetical protein
MFHYTKSDTAIYYILRNRTLKFGKFRTVNDPRESKIWPFKFYCSSSDSRDLFKSHLFDDVHDYILDNTHLLCFSNSLEETDESKQSAFSELNEGWAYHRMWAQYADNHKGVCIMFDKTKLQESLKSDLRDCSILGDSISYINHKNDNELTNDPYMINLEDFVKMGTSEYMNNHIRQFPKELFLMKHDNWQDEHEFRYIIFGHENEYYLNIQDAITGIILGEEFDNSQLKEILELANELNIDVYRIYTRGWAVNLFKVEDEGTNVVSLNGISYPINFYYELLFAQACDPSGNIRTILFDFHDNGAVKILD